MWVKRMPFCSAAERVMSSDSQMARTLPWIASGRRDAISAASSCARAHRSARGTISVTIPRRIAVSAVRRSSLPSSAHRSTSPSGTLRRNNPMGSNADTTPRDACGSKNVASSEQMMMSDSLTKY